MLDVKARPGWGSGGPPGSGAAPYPRWHITTIPDPGGLLVQSQNHTVATGDPFFLVYPRERGASRRFVSLPVINTFYVCVKVCLPDTL